MATLMAKPLAGCVARRAGAARPNPAQRNVMVAASAGTAALPAVRAGPALFEHITLRDLEIRNRIWMSPMCMYSAEEGMPSDWHLVHLGARAAGGCGLVMAEATAVLPEGRISPGCTGIWNDQQMEAWKPVTRFIRSQGAVAAIQLAHAGRKASTCSPYENRGAPLIPGKDPRAWPIYAPSAVPFDPSHQVPREMTQADIQMVTDAFVAAAKRAVEAGFQVIELHMAHGYLMHEFLSPISNKRTDEFGGSLENRMRAPLALAKAVRAAIPKGMPLLVRISATDHALPSDGPAWDVDQSVVLCRALQDRAGVDLVDVSSGGSLPRGFATVGPGYQVPFSERIRAEVGIPVGAVGMITQAAHAESILAEGLADVVFIGRELLRDPNWPLRAAAELGYAGAPYPFQYSLTPFPLGLKKGQGVSIP
ncbi:hypothetical protein HYH03_007938 [Edaphochlamys debaryana]|uniref:NADH:flavin oxidoreductase/NADH oxidase N-terminal domain-containing protein n=1 Tax=Edaphochlamys debaryana TaxID=47281 RepID=A0A835Y168_9CHLO|nr:hypothetical protein HYH03_007938 [Edaphochlamys debaryana]|eukprot:KAG2494011.1 hypothetical protein HYH03_007938 [Edaphochlamys debaryana]